MKTLSANEKDAIALMMEALKDDRRWDEAFDRSPELLTQLAASAMAEHHAVKTQALDPETL